jgi:uncharacterized protein (DUF2147 family)
MRKFQSIIGAAILSAIAVLPVSASDPTGTYADKWGTTFTFRLCGDGTQLCATLNALKGKSATPDNLAYVGKQVMQAQQVNGNSWKGKIKAGRMSATATATQTGPDTIALKGCRAVLCQTIVYKRR